MDAFKHGDRLMHAIRTRFMILQMQGHGGSAKTLQTCVWLAHLVLYCYRAKQSAHLSIICLLKHRNPQLVYKKAGGHVCTCVELL